MKKQLSLTKTNLVLLGILLAAFALRFYHLGFQSFWLDELQAVRETALSGNWKELSWFLRYADFNPPLFFILEKITFHFFGIHEFTARAVSAIAGIINVWAVYLLGKELYSKRLGCIAALFVCINPFFIYYAQEARPYALAALMATFSFLFLIRFIKTPDRKHSLYYAVFTLLMLYTHYFGLFVLVAQFIIVIICGINAPGRKKFFTNFVISGLIILLGFLPLLSLLHTISGVRSIWINPPSEHFAADFFFRFFGNSDLLKPFLYLFLLSLFVHLFILSPKEKGNIRNRPLTFSFLICSVWIFTVFLIPYLRSVIVVPMLVPRYTIVLLPAFIILLALGVELISSKTIQYALLSFFVIASIVHIFPVTKYYSAISKTQFRQLAETIAKNKTGVYPVVAGKTAWHQQYYLHQFGFRGKVIAGEREQVMDSLLRENKQRSDIAGFWITGAHNDKQLLPPEVYARLDSAFYLVQQYDFFDARAQLYFSRSGKEDANNKKFRQFKMQPVIRLNKEQVAVVWDTAAVSDTVLLQKGKYKMMLFARGTSVDGIYPHITLSVGNKAVGSCYLSSNYEQKTFTFTIEQNINTVCTISMDNDAVDKSKREDRNVLIKSVRYMRVE